MASFKTTVMATFDHLDLFDKMKCKSWIENLEFFLQQENIYYVLTEPCPKVPKHAPGDNTLKIKIAKWKEDDCLCRNFILRTMFNPQLCTKCKTAKDLWDTLKTAYMDEMKQESWRELRMDFFLRQKEIAYVLIEPCPNADHILSDQGKHEDINEKIRKWKEDDYSCRNLILQEAVVPQFAKYKTAKDLRDTLKTFYMTEDSSRIAENNRETIRVRREVVQKHYEDIITSLTRKELEGNDEITRLKHKIAEEDEEITRLKQERGERDDVAQKNYEETIKKLAKKVAKSDEELSKLKQEQAKKDDDDREETTRLKHDVAQKDDEIKRLKQIVRQRSDQIHASSTLSSESGVIKKLRQELARRDEEVKMLRCAIVPAWKQLDRAIRSFSKQNSVPLEEEEESDDQSLIKLVSESILDEDSAKFDESDDDCDEKIELQKEEEDGNKLLEVIYKQIHRQQEAFQLEEGSDGVSELPEINVEINDEYRISKKIDIVGVKATPYGSKLSSLNILNF